MTRISLSAAAEVERRSSEHCWRRIDRCAHLQSLVYRHASHHPPLITATFFLSLHETFKMGQLPRSRWLAGKVLRSRAQPFQRVKKSNRGVWQQHHNLRSNRAVSEDPWQRHHPATSATVNPLYSRPASENSACITYIGVWVQEKWLRLCCYRTLWALRHHGEHHISMYVFRYIFRVLHKEPNNI